MNEQDKMWEIEMLNFRGDAKKIKKMFE